MVDRKRDKTYISGVFHKHYRRGVKAFEFARQEINEVADAFGIERSGNPGHVIYHFRTRASMPEEIARTAPRGKEWTIVLAGRGRYRFVLVDAGANRIEPRWQQDVVKVPDATPELVVAHAKGDEQAALAKIRYNRLIDLFMSVNAYSLQNHLRTTIQGKGQIEVDELYVAVDRSGAQYVIPVQAKRRRDRPVAVQAMQDAEYCESRYPQLICRPVAVHTGSDGRIAMLELKRKKNRIVVVNERHYALVPSSDISSDDIESYNLDSLRVRP